MHVNDLCLCFLLAPTLQTRKYNNLHFRNAPSQWVWFRNATQWQTRLSDLGYDSAVAQFSEPDGQGDSVLKTWYQGKKIQDMWYSHTLIMRLSFRIT